MNNILNTKVKVFRNVKDYKFSCKLEKEKQDEIVVKLTEVFKDFELKNIAEIDNNTINYLKENNLINSSLKQFLINKEKSVIISLFENEHITIISSNKNINKAYKNVKEISDILQNKINLSYSDEFGYLMSDLTNIGSGLKLICEIDLTCVKTLGKIEQVAQNLKKLGYVLTETSKTNTFKLTGLCNLGVLEKDVLSNFEKIQNHLQEIETESAKMLDVSNHDEMLNNAMRSLSLLKGSYLMSYSELNSHISNLRIARNLNYFEIDKDIIYKLQTICKDNKEFMSQSELKQVAQQAKQVLKGVENV